MIGFCSYYNNYVLRQKMLKKMNIIDTEDVEEDEHYWHDGGYTDGN